MPAFFAKQTDRFVAVTVLPVPPFGENTVMTRPVAARVSPLAAPTRVARLADREDDVLGQLRKEQHVGDVGVERLFEQSRGLARGDEDDRRLRVLADRRDLVGGQRRAARGVQHSLEMSAGQRAGSCTGTWSAWPTSSSSE